MDTAIAEATADWTRARTRAAVARARLVAAPAAAVAATGRRLPPPPAWWKGDEDATRSALVARQQLRQTGG